MRESLTVLAILLIVVLTTALVGPYLVDWNAHRGEIEARLSQVLGASVTVAGPIDVKLLPRPIFRLQDIAVHGADPQTGTVAAAGMDVELSLTALLRGAFEIVEADLTSPTVTLTVGPDGAVALPSLGQDTAGRISLVSVVLRDGTLVLQKPDGTPVLTAAGIAGEGNAETLAGPFKFEGGLDTSRGPLALRLATGVIEGGRMRLKVTTDASAGLPKTDIDGMVTSTGDGPDTTLAFDGTGSAGGTAPLPGSEAGVPWRATARLHGQAGRVDLLDGELRAGLDGRALIATLAGEITAAPRLAANFTLRARQADLDKLAVTPEQAAADDIGAAAPSADKAGGGAQGGDGLAVLGALARADGLTAGLPLPVTVDATLDAVSAGTLTAIDLAAKMTAAPGQPIAGTLSFGATDGGRARFEGTFEPGAAAAFKGRAAASTPHLQRLLDSLAADDPALAATLRQALPVDAFRAEGTIDLSGAGFAAHDVTVALDRSDFAGTVTLTPGTGSTRTRLFADLTSDALDLDALPGLRSTAAAAADLDVSLTLVARALRFAGGDTGSLNAGRVALQLDKKGAVTTLDHLSLADLGGATAEITGRSDGTAAHVEGRVDAPRLRGLLVIADRLLPGALADRLLSRAEALSPALLTVMGDARIAPDGSVTPSLLSLGGTAAATTLALHLRPEAGSGNASAAAPFALDLQLDAPEGGALLRQAGLGGPAATGALGPGHMALRAHRDSTGAGAATLDTRFGDTVLTLEGRGDAAGQGTGHLAVKTPNVAPLARALLLATPEAGAVWPVDLAGAVGYADRRLAMTGFGGTVLGAKVKADLGYALPPAGGSEATAPALTGSLAFDRLSLPVLASLVLGPLPAAKPGALWPDAAFAPAVLALPRGEMALTVGTLPLWGGAVADAATATVRVGPGALTLDTLSAKLGRGHVGGLVTLRRDGPAASVAGHLDWAGLPLATPSVGGTAHGTLDLAGTGPSVAGLVASLAGTGTLGLDEARLPRLDPGAVDRVIEGTDAAASTIDTSAIADTLERELDRGALSLGAVTAPITVATGVLRAGPVRADSGPVQVDAAGSLDLTSLLLALRTTATVTHPPKDWVGAAPQVGVQWKGPFAAPTRTIDAATLVNGIAARAIARDQARIEAFQDDIRERAFFARRLKAIEAEQQAARDKAKAEQDAADKLKMQQLINGLAGSPIPPPVLTTPTPPRRPGGAKPMELH